MHVSMIGTKNVALFPKLLAVAINYCEFTENTPPINVLRC